MVNLGDKVKDSVSGFKGIAISKHTYLQGCSRFSVQPALTMTASYPKSNRLTSRNSK